MPGVEKIKCVIEFKQEIEEDLKDIVDKVEIVKQKILVNKYHKDTKKGLLTCETEEYFRSISI